nr:glycosyltransferase [Neobacillus sp. Marseille-Q6967]
MRILFISSGFLGIYPFFEKSIVETFLSFNHAIQKIAPEYSTEIIKSIEAFNPDFVLTFVGYKTDNRLLTFIKEKNIPMGVWLTDDPYYIDQSTVVINDYDYVFTVDLGAFEFYKENFQEKKIYHLPLGTDTTQYHPLDSPTPYLYDLCLVGFPYTERVRLIQEIIEKTPYSIILAGPLWRKYFNNKDSNKINIINRWIAPEHVRQLFTFSKIILNPHRSYNFHKNLNSLGIKAKSINNRTFDIAACACFQLIEKKPDLHLHFSPDQDIISYTDFDHCIHQIHHFIDDESSRTFYSHNSRKRMLNDHTMTRRVEFIIAQLNSGNVQISQVRGG